MTGIGCFCNICSVHSSDLFLNNPNRATTFAFYQKRKSNINKKNFLWCKCCSEMLWDRSSEISIDPLTHMCVCIICRLVECWKNNKITQTFKRCRVFLLPSAGLNENTFVSGKSIVSSPADDLPGRLSAAVWWYLTRGNVWK